MTWNGPTFVKRADDYVPPPPADDIYVKVGPGDTTTNYLSIKLESADGSIIYSIRTDGITGEQFLDLSVSVQKGRTLFVDETLGNDTTGQRTHFDTTRTYATIDGALADFQANDQIVVFPGNYIVSVQIGNYPVAIYCYPEVTISGAGIIGTMTDDFKLLGYADLLDSGSLCNSAGSNNIIQCKSIEADSIVLAGAINLVIDVLDNVTVHGAGSTGIFFTLQTTVYFKATRFVLPPGAGSTLFRFSSLSLNSIISIKGDSFINGGLGFCTCTQATGVSMQGTVTYTGDIYCTAVINGFLIYAEENRRSNASSPFGLYINSNIYRNANSNMVVLYMNVFGESTFSGKIFNNTTDVNGYVAAVNDSGIIRFNDTDIYDSRAANAFYPAPLMFVFNSTTIANFILKNVKIISTNNTPLLFAIAGGAGTYEYTCIEASSNIATADGPNVNNKVSSTQLVCDTNIE